MEMMRPLLLRLRHAHVLQLLRLRVLRPQQQRDWLDGVDGDDGAAVGGGAVVVAGVADVGQGPVEDATVV